eukprot:Seg2175.7 transcript_id=Seg2175.7/GoldUCD/mRNA.D3Y31 product="hypothetical protein" protein_id=Seg2175.7/GoldUCD/D3Y31
MYRRCCFLIAVILMTHFQAAWSHKKKKGCSPYCGKTSGSGKCEKDGKCLCWWGRTGPNSFYVKRGKKKGRIQAEFCEWSCDYSPTNQRADCADNGVGAEDYYSDHSSGSSGSESECEDDHDHHKHHDHKKPHHH